MKKSITCMLLLLCGTGWVHATGNDSLDLMYPASKMGKFFTIGFGSDNAKFRDFATSPLFYKGSASQIQLSYLRMTEKKEVELQGRYIFGNYVNQDSESDLISNVKTFGVYYSRLYPFNLFKNERFRFLAGGMFDVTGNIRQNPSLFNNALGLEIFSTLSVSGKVIMDVSRNRSFHKKFLFIKINRQPRKRELSFRLNPALMNITMRNPYIYSNESPVNNESSIFYNYEVKAFSGYRLSSQLDYTIYLKNYNRIRFAYIWDAYMTGGDLDKFEMAHHIFNFSFLINLK